MTDDDIGEVVLLGPEPIAEITKWIALIKQRLQAAKNMKKYYADKGRRLQTYEVSDLVFIKVTSHRGLLR